MSWSDRTGDPLPPGHPERRKPRTGEATRSLVRSWVLVVVTAVTGRRSAR